MASSGSKRGQHRAILAILGLCWPILGLCGLSLRPMLGHLGAMWASLAPRCAYYRPCGWATNHHHNNNNNQQQQPTTNNKQQTTNERTNEQTNKQRQPTLQTPRNLRCFFGFPMRPCIILNTFVTLYPQFFCAIYFRADAHRRLRRTTRPSISSQCGRESYWMRTCFRNIQKYIP